MDRSAFLLDPEYSFLKEETDGVGNHNDTGSNHEMSIHHQSSETTEREVSNWQKSREVAYQALKCLQSMESEKTQCRNDGNNDKALLFAYNKPSKKNHNFRKTSLLPSSDKQIQKDVAEGDGLAFEFPQDNDSFVAVRKYLYDILTNGEWGIGERHPEAVQATVDRWMGTGWYLRHLYSQGPKSLEDICPAVAVAIENGRPHMRSIDRFVRTLISMSVFHEMHRYFRNKARPTSIHSGISTYISQSQQGQSLVSCGSHSNLSSTLFTNFRPTAEILGNRVKIALPKHSCSSPRPPLFQEWIAEDKPDKLPSPQEDLALSDEIQSSTQASFDYTPPPTNTESQDFERTSVRQSFLLQDSVSPLLHSLHRAPSLQPSKRRNRSLQDLVRFPKRDSSHPCLSPESGIKSICFEETVADRTSSTNKNQIPTPQKQTSLGNEDKRFTTSIPIPFIFRQTRRFINAAARFIIPSSASKNYSGSTIPTHVHPVASSAPRISESRLGDAIIVGEKGNESIGPTEHVAWPTESHLQQNASKYHKPGNNSVKLPKISSDQPFSSKGQGIMGEIEEFQTTHDSKASTSSKAPSNIPRECIENIQASMTRPIDSLIVTVKEVEDPNVIAPASSTLEHGPMNFTPDTADNCLHQSKDNNHEVSPVPRPARKFTIGKKLKKMFAKINARAKQRYG